MARPYARLPAGSRDTLLDIAKTGITESIAAKATGIPLHEFRRVIANNPTAKEVWQEALSVERDVFC